MHRLAIASTSLLAIATFAWAAEVREPVTQLTEVAVTYLERCGGCHGIHGHSAPGEVPSLRGQVGYFLCVPEGRAYLARLPSVALSPLDDQQLAQLLNFVVFELGGAQDGGEAQRYTATEVGQLRQQPLNDVSLAAFRAGLVDRMISRCGAPTSLREYASTMSK